MLKSTNFGMFGLAVLALALMAGNSFAYISSDLKSTGDVASNSFGSNVTVWDGSGSAGDSGWWGGYHEDQEVQPSCYTGQNWDLEGFFVKGSTLTMIGGWNFKNGFEGKTSGDLFIDTNQDASIPSPSGVATSTTTTNKFGYDYAVHFDWTGSADTYSVYDLNGATLGVANTKTVDESINAGSDPWAYVSGGTKIDSGNYVYKTGLTNAATGFLGDGTTAAGQGDYAQGPWSTASHNAVSVDMSWLYNLVSDNSQLLFHFTMQCGNDDLMGHTIVAKDTYTNDDQPHLDLSQVPEPASMVLLGAGLVGIVLRRKLALPFVKTSKF